MRRMYDSVVGKVLVFAAGAFIALAVSGCGNSTQADMAANHRRLSDECRQELHYGLSGYAPATQARSFYPAR
jgi:hypothetical protein